MYITKRGVASIMKNTSPHRPLLVGKEGGHTSLYTLWESLVCGHIWSPLCLGLTVVLPLWPVPKRAPTLVEQVKEVGGQGPHACGGHSTASLQYSLLSIYTLYFATSQWWRNIYNFKVVTVGHITQHLCIIQHSHIYMSREFCFCCHNRVLFTYIVGLLPNNIQLASFSFPLNTLYPLLFHLLVAAKYLQFQSGHSGSRHTTLLHHPAQPHLNADISRDFVDVATTVYCLCWFITTTL
jgi:hypothetical protein